MRRLGLSAVLIALAWSGPAAGAFAADRNRPAKVAPKSDAVLLNDAIAFLLDTFGNEYDVDRVSMAFAIVQRFPHAGLKTYADKGYVVLTRNPDPTRNPNFFRFVKTDAPLIQPLCGHTANESSLDCVMLQSAWCDVVEPPGDLLKYLQSRITAAKRGQDADKASHALLALSELKSRGCLNPAHVEALFREAARFLTRWLADSQDAYGEGVAVLLRVGLASEVQEEWVERVRDSVREKIETACSRCSGEPHDLLLEMYALAQWTRLQP